MAIYEYLCPRCQTEFDLMRPMSEADRPAACPECGSEMQLMDGCMTCLSCGDSKCG